MFAICLREFSSLFKSIRSIFIIAVIFGVTVGAAKLVGQFGSQVRELGFGSNVYAVGLLILILFLGPLFVTSLSHNVINRELDSRTIRFLATKISREKIVLGKFLGTLLFWLVCIFIASLLVVPFSKSFYFLEFVQSIIFISYFIGLFLFLSTLITKPSLTMFLGITIALILPVIGIWSMFSENKFITIISYITPYFYYGQEQSFYVYFVLLFTLLFLVMSILIIRKRDL